MQKTKNKQKLASLISLGCKVNKYEIDCMATILSENGYNITFTPEPADLYVIGTCAVTNEAEKKSRQYVAKLSKLNPEAKIIVCGCASQHDIEQFKKPNVISAIGNEGKEKILNLIENSEFNVLPDSINFAPLSKPYKAKTRAYLKVQDGCNNFCSYCLIPYLRGRSRSRDINEIICEAKELSKTSNEIVITGIDLSSFKINGKLALGELVYMLSDLNCRIRLGSLEVNVISKDFLEQLKKSINFAPQFHLSLQSGANSELKRMNRHYTTEEYINKVDLIRNYFPDANITTDIIVGFPEQSEKEFNETIETIKTVKFGHTHVFPYSLRNGTVAAKLKQVPNDIKSLRVKKLTEIAKQTENEFLLSMTNKNFTMLTESYNNGMWEGYTENYLKVYVKSENLIENQLIKVKMTKPYKQGMIAEILKD